MIYAGRLARSLVFWFASCLPLNYVVLRVLFFLLRLVGWLWNLWW